MNKICYFATICLAGILAASCDDKLVIDHVNEADYANVTELLAGLSDAGGRTSTVVDLHKKAWNTAVKVDLGRAPRKGVDMEVAFDPSYLEAYNKEHGTSFELFPEDHLTLADGGRIVIAPDEKTSYCIGLEIQPLGTEDYVNDKTYLLPLKLTTSTEGVRIPEQSGHCVYLVKNLAGMISADKSERYGDDYVRTVVYYEIGDTNPLNTLCCELETGELFMDYIILFAANIKFDQTKGELVILKNGAIQFYLDHYDQTIKPLRERGVKVLMGLLGADGPAGLAQLSDVGCKDFAKKIADMCYSYNLDGVNFDDEYSGSPDLSNPLFAPRSAERGSKLMFETKKAMPDKVVCTYQYGQCTGTNSVDGIDIAEWMDFIVADYGRTVNLYGSLTKKDVSGYSFHIHNGAGNESRARSIVSNGYGYCMMWSPWASQYAPALGNHYHSFNQFNAICKGLYGVGLKTPTQYWVKSDDIAVATTPVAF